jgi:CheY-like chemotaxis protein
MSPPQRILLIDDDDDDREIFLEVVSEIDPTVVAVTALNGAEGLTKLLSFEILPKVIFLDLNMPIMKGTEFLRKIKSMEPLRNIPVVILSTISDELAINEVRSLGATDFITKPDKFRDWQIALRPFVVSG